MLLAALLGLGERLGMLVVIQTGMWIATAVGVLFLLAAVVGKAPRVPALGLVGVAEAAVIIGLIADVVLLVRGQQIPDLVTHISYLLTVPFIIPLGIGLTYRKLDRWGLLIVGVASLVTAVLVLRQLQTLGPIHG